MAALPRLDVAPVFERNQQATLYVGNLEHRTDEELLWEIFTQAGPIKSVHVPRDKVTGAHSGYGFVEFHLESDAEYALRIMSMVKIYGKPMRCNRAAQDKRTFDIGANLFVGNLDPEVSDALLYETFAVFGHILSAKVVHDPETGEHRGFGFVSFDNFEASDAALAALNGQFLCDRPLQLSYAYKKDSRGERHGSAAERLLAANRTTAAAPQRDVDQQQALMTSMLTSMVSQIAQPGQQQQPGHTNQQQSNQANPFLHYHP